MRGRRRYGGALGVGRFPLAGLVRIAIMIPDAIRNGFKKSCARSEGALRLTQRLTDDMLNIFVLLENVRGEEDWTLLRLALLSMSLKD